MIEVTQKLRVPPKRVYPAQTKPLMSALPPEGLRCSFLPSDKLILVIDDSLTIRKIVEMTLDREGYQHQSFCDGIEAMRWFARPEARTPDLMFVDLGLPKMDGYGVIQKFKAKPRFAETVCIILSRRDGLVDKLKGKMVGAAGYITKPFTTQELVTTVQASITQRSLLTRAGE